MTRSKQLLLAAAILSFAIALFQAVLSFSPSLTRFFGAAQLAANPLLLLVSSLAATMVFAVFGLYALAGANTIRHLPLLRTGLVAIGVIYALRGLFLLPELLAMGGVLPAPEPVPPQAVLSSVVALATGVLYLLGTAASWKRLQPHARA
ncbi:MAG TPA: hypothetical protein VFO07_09635 [Roseiflexaceae bacterium]|nr:hypothetical protein [Roseiflexaceae bacterium]